MYTYVYAGIIKALQRTLEDTKNSLADVSSARDSACK